MFVVHLVRDGAKDEPLKGMAQKCQASSGQLRQRQKSAPLLAELEVVAQHRTVSPAPGCCNWV